MTNYLRKTSNVSNDKPQDKYEAADMLRQYRAAKRLPKKQKKPEWKLAQAAANNRRLLIGNGRMFRSPGQ